MLKLIVNYPVPSLNRLFAMYPMSRHTEKKRTQAAFLSALRLSASDSLTRTISAQNTLSIAADTLASYLGTRQVRSKSSPRRGGFLRRKKSTRKL